MSSKGKHKPAKPSKFKPKALLSDNSMKALSGCDSKHKAELLFGEFTLPRTFQATSLPNLDIPKKKPTQLMDLKAKLGGGKKARMLYGGSLTHLGSCSIYSTPFQTCRWCWARRTCA